MKNRERIWIGIGILIAIMGIWLPGVLVNWQAQKDRNVVHQTSGSNYYNGSQQAVFMTLYERMKLMSGEWDSSWQEVDPATIAAITDAPSNESENNGLETGGDLELIGCCYQNRQDVLELAEAGIDVFYQAGVYPQTVTSGYENWYRPSVHLYQYSDSVFEAYTCYAWLVELDYYDGSCRHVILIDDTSGLILAAGMLEDPAQSDTVSNTAIDTASNTTSNKVLNTAWIQQLEEQTQLPEAVAEYYREGQELTGTALNITDTACYQPSYALWEEEYRTLMGGSSSRRVQGEQKYLLSEKQEPVSYEEAVQEVKNIVDNDKFLYTMRWEKGQCQLSLTPFTVQMQE